jgi:uncharacterized protein YbjT (DUF2867 family)
MSAHSDIFLTGASGFIGGRLLEALSHQNVKINCLVRSPHLDHVRIHQGDLFEKESLYPSGNPSI